MKPEDILKQIRERKFQKIYVLAGEETYYIDQIYSALINSILKEEEREFNQSVYYGLDSNVMDILAEVKKYPMMSEYNVVAVREAQNLKNIDKLEAYFQAPIDSTILILTYKGKKMDKRKSLYKALQKNGLYFESNRLYDNQIPDWIMKYLSHSGFHISARNAAIITENLGNDLSNISNELSKIILNLPTGSTVGGEEIELYIGINKEYNTFELNNALGYKNVYKANRIVQYLGQNEKKFPLPLITASLYTFFSKVIMMHYVGGRSRQEQASFIGVNPFFVKDYQEAAKNYPLKKLVNVIDLLFQYDQKSKGINNVSVPGRELMKEMIYRILH